ncbi:MAG: cysteine desulfurase [Parcubacteria group bacterium]|nr:cysteine desulfurase [Parcubacteria group bacterium]
MKRIYFDYAASTPMASAVVKVMKPYFSEKFGNAGSLHRFGQEAAAALEESREKILKIIGGTGKLIFTGSATEANNLALRGVVKAAWSRQKIAGRPYRIIVSGIEHESVLETARDLKRGGVEVVYIPVDREGVVDLRKLKESLNERTILVSVMFANNEIGTIQPISAIAEIIKEFRRKNLEFSNENKSKSHILNSIFYPIFHTDAVQALQFLDCDVDKSGVDLMSLSAQKIYGPKGIGALYVKNIESENQKIESHFLPPAPHSLNSKFPILNSIITGGLQEFGLRGGTVNIAGAVAFAKAAELAAGRRSGEGKRIGELRERFWRGIKKIFSRAEMNGVSFGSPRADSARPAFGGAGSPRAAALPNILNVYFPGRRAQELLVEMDLAGVAVSAGSACSAYAAKPSHVVAALGFKDGRASESLRFSFGSPTDEGEINEALKRIAGIFKKRK